MRFSIQNDKSSDFAQIYWICRQWSYDYFDQFYETIEVDPFKYYPESVCTPPGLELVDRGLNEGLFDKSEGAVVYSEAKSGLHTRVFVTSGGLPTYETKDLGVIKLELDDFNFDHRILITGRDQTEYMKVVYSAAGELMPQTKGNMTHLSNGIIKFGDGKKMSSRLGNVTTALDVIDNVKSIVEKTSSKEADTIMLGAVKYEFLKHKLGGDISFDPQESVSLQGNSGPYLQYAHARARSILEKVTNKNFEITNNIELNLHERLLARKLAQYQNVLSQAIDSYEVHIICTYLYELSQVFNRFYENNKVVGDDREPIRAFLVEQYADTLKNGSRNTRHQSPQQDVILTI
jgi:arginyl-tRNA synthetase